MIHLARARGVARLDLDILPENEAMQALARRFASVLEVRGDMIVTTIDAAFRPSADRRNKFLYSTIQKHSLQGH